jgi:succinate dehydrogenase / fumarate reductase cytochrome b subunit
MNSDSSKAYPNRLGLKGWMYAGRYSIERYLYLGHRVSGLGLIAYMVLHIVETANRIRGEEAWAGLMALFASPPFRVIEYLLFCMAVFHAMNGVRLILIELGFFLGKPQEPVYPYKSSVMKHRPLTHVVMLIAFVVMVLGSSSLFYK